MFLKKNVLILLAIMLVCGTSASFATDNTSNIQSIVLEDFELTEGQPQRYWYVEPNRFGRQGSTDAGANLQQWRWVKAWPEAYFGNEIADKGQGEFFYGPEKTETNIQRYTDVSGTCFGMYLTWERQGYNVAELYPVIKAEGADKYSKSLIPFRGKVREIDFWVWGSNFNYTMEIVLQDYRGVEHRLNVGSIKHIGWKNFKVTVPHTIPQTVPTIPSAKVFGLKKIVIWTNPNARVSGSYVYIDHIKYLADVFEEIYDGYQLGDVDQIKELWKEEGAVTGPTEEEVNK